MENNDAEKLEPSAFLKSMIVAFKGSSFLFWIKDHQGHYIYVNPSFLQLLYRKEKDFIGFRDEELQNKSYIRFFYNPFDENIEKTNFFLKLEIKKKSFYFKVNYNEFKDEADKTIYTSYIAENITQQKETEQKIMRREFELSILQEFASTTAKKLDISVLVDSAEKALRRLVNAQKSYILFYNEETQAMMDIAHPFWNHDPKNIANCYGALKAYQTQSHFFCKTSEHPNDSVRKYLSKNNIKALHCLPIFYNGQVFAVLLMTFDLELSLSSNDIKVITTLCDHLSILLQNTLLIKESMKELTDRLKAEKDIDEIFNETTDILALADDRGYFRRINPATSHILGYSEEELLSVSYLNFVYPEDKGNTMDVIKDIDQIPVVSDFQNRYIHKNGSLITLQWKAKFLKEGRYFIATARDITQQIHMEKKNIELQQTIELEKLRSEFFANLSHELKTPINIIMSASHLMQSKLELGFEKINIPDLEKLNSYLQTNSYRLLKLIINLLDLSKLDAGNYAMHSIDLEFVSFINDIVLSTQSYCERKQILISFASELKKCILNCDPDFIDRIMLNLLSNAVKYSNPQTHIHVSINKTEEWLILKVQDEGIGIEKKQIENIFNRFHRVDNSMHRREEGSGIGLSIVKSLVEMHHGSINVQSEVNKGTCVIIKLPFIQTNPNISCQPIEDEYASTRQYHLNIEFSDLK